MLIWVVFNHISPCDFIRSLAGPTICQLVIVTDRLLGEENTALRAELASLRAENQALLEQLRQLQQRLSGTEGPEPGPEPDAESSTNV